MQLYELLSASQYFMHLSPTVLRGNSSSQYVVNPIELGKDQDHDGENFQSLHYVIEYRTNRVIIRYLRTQSPFYLISCLYKKYRIYFKKSERVENTGIRRIQDRRRIPRCVGSRKKEDTAQYISSSLTDLLRDLRSKARAHSFMWCVLDYRRYLTCVLTQRQIDPLSSLTLPGLFHDSPKPFPISNALLPLNPQYIVEFKQIIIRHFNSIALRDPKSVRVL